MGVVSLFDDGIGFAHDCLMRVNWRWKSAAGPSTRSPASTTTWPKAKGRSVAAPAARGFAAHILAADIIFVAT
jgi:hypothetical protein